MDTMDPQSIVNNNNYARGAILGNAVDTWQQIYSVARDPSESNVFNVQLRNVGLIKGFLVQVAGTIRNTAADTTTATLTELGAANFVQQFVLSDFSNTTRIQTTGWHIHLINSAKQALVFGGAYAPNIPVKYGNNWTVQSAAATIAPATDAAVSFFYYIPCAYSKDDLRGAIFASVVNSTASLQITLNTQIMLASGDATLASYSGSTGGWKANTSVTITVWQNYLDQLPRDQNGSYILPPLDMNTIYELKNTALSGMVAGQDFGVTYANYRTFLSTVVIVDNGGTLNTGSDINYFALQAANTTQIFKYPANVAALLARTTFYADPPKGTYYFDFRARPINTQQFGNMQLSVNMSSVSANSAILVGFEDFASVSQVQNASSLPTAA